MTQTLQYLLDTDMCIYLLNGDERVKNRVAQVGKVVTNNTEHFERITDISLENWLRQAESEPITEDIEVHPIS